MISAKEARQLSDEHRKSFEDLCMEHVQGEIVKKSQQPYENNFIFISAREYYACKEPLVALGYVVETYCEDRSRVEPKYKVSW